MKGIGRSMKRYEFLPPWSLPVLSDDASSTVYEFAGYRLDPARRSLTQADGGELKLTGRPFDTLVYLVEHAGEVVDRDALVHAVWPRRVVEDNNLNQAIAVLRRLLGEQHIVTVAGRGYQFVTPVHAVVVEPHESTGARAEKSAQARALCTCTAMPPLVEQRTPLRNRPRRQVAPGSRGHGSEQHDSHQFYPVTALAVLAVALMAFDRDGMRRAVRPGASRSYLATTSAPIRTTPISRPGSMRSC